MMAGNQPSCDEGKDILKNLIVSTSISKLVDFKSLMNRGFTGNIPPAGHLVKPHSADDLIKVIRDVLG